MDNEKAHIDLIAKHYRDNWGSNYQIKRFENGPMKVLSKEFCCLEFPPSKKRAMWTYATCGMSSCYDTNPIELHIFSANQHQNIIEILTAVAYYHKTDAKLGLHHTVNFGVPWQMGSECSYGLVSLPYLDGPDLEVYKKDLPFSIHFYWLIPITLSELNYKKTFGIEALEEKFDTCEFSYLNPLRKSIV